MNNATNLNLRQQVFNEMLLGTLIYSVVLGFFNDYTNILITSSYSITFLSAFVIQLLVYPTFKLKSFLAKWWSKRTGKYIKIGMVLSIWLVMFFSKFIFLEVIDIIFGQNVEISGFVGLIIIILTASILTKILDIIYKKI